MSRGSFALAFAAELDAVRLTFARGLLLPGRWGVSDEPDPAEVRRLAYAMAAAEKLAIEFAALAIANPNPCSTPPEVCR